MISMVGLISLFSKSRSNCKLREEEEKSGQSEASKLLCMLPIKRLWVPHKKWSSLSVSAALLALKCDRLPKSLNATKYTHAHKYASLAIPILLFFNLPTFGYWKQIIGSTSFIANIIT